MPRLVHKKESTTLGKVNPHKGKKKNTPEHAKIKSSTSTSVYFRSIKGKLYGKSLFRMIVCSFTLDFQKSKYKKKKLYISYRLKELPTTS